MTKNEVALSIIINKFAKKNDIYLNDFTPKDYKKTLETLRVEELDYETMLKLVERFK